MATLSANDFVTFSEMNEILVLSRDQLRKNNHAPPRGDFGVPPTIVPFPRRTGKPGNPQPVESPVRPSASLACFHPGNSTRLFFLFLFLQAKILLFQISQLSVAAVLNGCPVSASAFSLPHWPGPASSPVPRRVRPWPPFVPMLPLVQQPRQWCPGSRPPPALPRPEIPGYERENSRSLALMFSRPGLLENHPRVATAATDHRRRCRPVRPHVSGVGGLGGPTFERAGWRVGGSGAPNPYRDDVPSRDSRNRRNPSPTPSDGLPASPQPSPQCPVRRREAPFRGGFFSPGFRPLWAP